MNKNSAKRSGPERNPFGPKPEPGVPIRRRVPQRFVRYSRRGAGVMAANRSAVNWSPAVQVSADERECVIQPNLPRWMDDDLLAAWDRWRWKAWIESRKGQDG